MLLILRQWIKRKIFIPDSFSRNKENFEFISTLTRFVLVGEQTWNYENGEKDARGYLLG